MNRLIVIDRYRLLSVVIDYRFHRLVRPGPYHYVTHLKGSMLIVVTLKSKMAAGSTSSGRNSKSTGSRIERSNKSPEPLIDGPTTSEHISALLPFRSPASGKYDAILNSCGTTTSTMHVRAAKALLYVVMHKVYCKEKAACISWPKLSCTFSLVAILRASVV